MRAPRGQSGGWIGRKEFPREKSFRLSPRERAIAGGIKWLRVRIESCRVYIVRIFERNLPPRPSFLSYLFIRSKLVRNETKTNSFSSFVQFEKKKKAK